MITLKNNRPVIVGIFILIGLVIFVITIFTLGGQKKTFVKSITVNAVFDDVNGLLTGANIWYSGVKVGTVKKISFYNDSKVEVAMNIDKEAQKHIHKDAKAKIGSDGLIGNKIIIIYGGTESKPYVEKDDILSVEKTLSNDEMLATLQVTNKNLLDITNDFKSISKKMDSGNGTLASLLNDPTLANKLNATADNLQATITNLKTVSVDLKGVSAGGQKVVSNLQTFSGKLNNPESSINGILTDTGMYTNIKTTLAELQNASTSVTLFATNLKTASERLNQKDNTVGALLNDSTAASSIKSTLKNLETSSKKLDEDLEALQHSFLLRRYFKKKEKAKIQ